MGSFPFPALNSNSTIRRPSLLEYLKEKIWRDVTGKSELPEGMYGDTPLGPMGAVMLPKGLPAYAEKVSLKAPNLLEKILATSTSPRLHGNFGEEVGVRGFFDPDTKEIILSNDPMKWHNSLARDMGFAHTDDAYNKGLGYYRSALFPEDPIPGIELVAPYNKPREGKAADFIKELLKKVYGGSTLVENYRGSPFRIEASSPEDALRQILRKEASKSRY